MIKGRGLSEAGFAGFWDFRDSCERLMFVQRTLLASVERVVCWGAIGWDVRGTMGLSQIIG